MENPDFQRIGAASGSRGRMSQLFFHCGLLAPRTVSPGSSQYPFVSENWTGGASRTSTHPSMFVRPTSWLGSDPDTIWWAEIATTDGRREAPHYPSKLAREGDIRNLVSCNGIVDRGDGRGGFSLTALILGILEMLTTAVLFIVLFCAALLFQVFRAG